MSRIRIWTLLGVAALSDGVLGCDLSCDKEDGDAVPYIYGDTSPDGTEYQTTDWNEKWVDFPAGHRVLIEHGLRAEPKGVFTWLAFDEEPLNREQGNTSESAGNQTIIERVTDREIVVHNDTCQDFYLRLVANLSPGWLSDEGTGGAPSDGDGGAGGI